MRYMNDSPAKSVSDRERALPITLENPDDFRLYLLVPEENSFAAFGLMEKFIAPKTISSITGQTVLLKERGTFLFASRQLVKEVLVNGEQVSFQKDGEFYEVEILVPNEAMLTVKV